MDKKIVDINEEIADARAEEEARQQIAKAKVEQALQRIEQAKEDAKAKIDALKPKITVTIDLEEYTRLNMVDVDHARLLDVIAQSATLSSYNDSLYVGSANDIMDCIKFLYPDYYAELKEALMEKKFAEAYNNE